MTKQSLPDKQGYYGPFGGRFAPETLMAVLAQLEKQYRAIKKDKIFSRRNLSFILRNMPEGRRIYIWPNA